MACAFERAIMICSISDSLHVMGYVRTALAYGRAISVQDDAILSLRKPDENVNEVSKKKTACACCQFLWRNPCIYSVLITVWADWAIYWCQRVDIPMQTLTCRIAAGLLHGGHSSVARVAMPSCCYCCCQAASTGVGRLVGLTSLKFSRAMLLMLLKVSTLYAVFSKYS